MLDSTKKMGDSDDDHDRQILKPSYWAGMQARKFSVHLFPWTRNFQHLGEKRLGSFPCTGGRKRTGACMNSG